MFQTCMPLYLSQNNFRKTDNFNFYTALGSDMSMLEFLLPRMIGLFVLGFMAGFVWVWCTFINPEDPGMVIFEDEAELQEMCMNGLRRVKE
jgi:hypothetical protein